MEHTQKQGKARQAAFIHSTRLEQYHYPPDCPFSTARAGEAYRICQSMGLLSGAHRREVAPQPAGRDALLAFHTAGYLDALEKAPRGELDVEGLAMGIGTEDCPVFIGMYDYACLACGGTLAGAELILAGEADAAFNPSGGYHHARSEGASGFCFINDIVLACMRLAGGGRRVLFLDIDAHHGDGVQEAFYDRRDVMTISFHESGKTLFPGTGFENEIGAGDGKGYAVNVPLPAGLHDEAFGRAFREVAIPLIGAFDADAIVMELGMDMLSGDPLAHLKLTNNASADAIEQVLGFGRPVLATGGGGYHVHNTARGWALAWSVLCGAAEAAEQSSAGLGGVLMETTDWHGGLRDRALVHEDADRARVDAAVNRTIEKVKANVFGYHGL